MAIRFLNNVPGSDNPLDERTMTSLVEME
jgi:hypothetical protein